MWEALKKTIAKAYIKADGTLATTMIIMDIVTAAGAVSLTLEIYGYSTGLFASAINMIAGVGGRYLRQMTDTPMAGRTTKTLPAVDPTSNPV